MPLSDHYRGGMTEKMLVTVVTADPATKRIEVVGRDAAVIQIGVDAVGTIFRFPQVGELWTIKRENGVWSLGDMIENPDAVKNVQTLLAGEALIQAENIYTPSGKRLITNVDGSAILQEVTDGDAELDVRIDALESPLSGFEMYNDTTTASVFASAAFTKVPYNQLPYGSGGGASIANDNFVVPAGLDGWWLFSAGVTTSDNVTDGATVALALFLNGVEYRRLNTWFQGSSNQPSIGGSIPVRAVAGSTWDIRFYHSSVGSRGVNGGQQYTYFHGVRLSG